MKRKSLLIIAITVLLATVFNLFAGMTVFADDSVIQITDVNGLLAVKDGLSGNYKLMSDIVLSDDKSYAWTPIGDGDTPFSGTFDGNGYTISGFTVSDTQQVEAGFFGVVSGTVKNLTLANASINSSAADKYATSSYQIGAFAGVLTGTISNCKTESTVGISAGVLHAGELTMGGFAGYVSTSGVIEYCVNNASINCWYNKGFNYSNSSYFNTGNFAGGIVGRIYMGTISHCINNGAIYIKDCNGNLDNYTACGGIVGGLGAWNNATATVEYCINNASVHQNSSSVTRASAAGIVGSACYSKNNQGTLNINNNCNFGEIKGGTANADYLGQIVGNQLVAFNAEGNYATTGKGNLYANVVTVVDGMTLVDDITADESGSAVYATCLIKSIDTAQELNDFSTVYAMFPDVWTTYKLTADIDLGGAAWTPISEFALTFDGNGKTVSGFTVNADTESYAGGTQAGFFGTLTGTVKNLTIGNATLYASKTVNQIGVIVAQSKGTVEGCKVLSTVSVVTPEDGLYDGWLQIGGITGYSNSGTVIKYCENNMDISVLKCHGANDTTAQVVHIGGIAGRIGEGTISHCVNNGDINLGDYAYKHGTKWVGVGGIGGKFYSWSGAKPVVEYCINNGTVSSITDTSASTSPQYVGGAGIVGSSHASSNTPSVTVRYSYNFGKIVSGKLNSAYCGPILGFGGVTPTYEGNYAADNGAVIDPNDVGTGKSGTIMSAASIVKLDAYKTLAAELRENGIDVALTATDFVGYQTSNTTRNKSDNDTTQVFDTRLVAVIGGDISDCECVGFDVTATYDNLAQPNTTDETMTTVYTAIAGVTDTGTIEYTAEQLGGDYIFVLACRGLPTNVGDITFTVTTYYTDSTGTVRSTVETFTIDSTAFPNSAMPNVEA